MLYKAFMASRYSLNKIILIIQKHLEERLQFYLGYKNPYPFVKDARWSNKEHKKKST